jgi:signal transduction histidine kinase
MGEMVTLLSPPQGFVISYHTDVALVHTSRIALEQILINLCTNAIKYNDKQDGKVHVSLTETTDAYQLVIEDNGPGIPAAHHDKIFRLFHTLGVKDRFDQEGTGIGLATVKKLAEQLNGHITVSSEEGKGTSFTVVLGK